MITAPDPYMLQQASRQAGLLVATAGFKAQDWEDLRQELVLDLLQRARRFDPTRGDWHGFVRGVLRNHATVLLKRRRRRATELLGADLITGGDTDARDPMDILDSRHCHDVVDALHLSLDVRTVVAGLPSQLQSLTLLLGQMPIKEVCKRTGKSRSRVYQLTKQIRQAFVRTGSMPPNRHRRSTVRNTHLERAK